MSRLGAMFDPLAGADRVKVPPRCSCRDESHGHAVPCFRPAARADGLCPHCRRGVPCTAELFTAGLIHAAGGTVQQRIILDAEVFDEFSAEIENPREPTEALRKLFRDSE